MDSQKPEKHRTQNIGWLRAAVLGANDGIVSTSSLLVGVASSGSSHNAVMIAGVSSLIAGAVSMAAGEYVSVSSQSDTEKADILIESKELATDPESEKKELASIYVSRGLDKDLATKVAEQLMAKDALSAHVRDELGISDVVTARPIQAAISSAAAFSVGAFLPLISAYLSSLSDIVIVISMTSLIFLSVLGALAAYIGGSDMKTSIVRVVFWGALAMGLTALVGHLFGSVPV